MSKTFLESVWNEKIISVLFQICGRLGTWYQCFSGTCSNIPFSCNHITMNYGDRRHSLKKAQLQTNLSSNTTTIDKASDIYCTSKRHWIVEMQATFSHYHQADYVLVMQALDMKYSQADDQSRDSSSSGRTEIRHTSGIWAKCIQHKDIICIVKGREVHPFLHHASCRDRVSSG